MNGAAQATVKGKRGVDYCVRPDDEPSNTGLPHYGKLIQHAIIPSDAVILSAVRSIPMSQAPDGWLLKECSITKIAAATRKFTHTEQPMARRTVAHRLRALVAKGLVRRWEVAAPVNSPFGTSWFFPSWKSVLETWAADSNIGTVGNRAFYVQGKSKRFLTPADLVRWKLDHGAAEKLPGAQAAEVAVTEFGSPPAAADPVAQAAVAAPRKSAPTDSETRAGDVETVLNSILDQQVPSTPEFAASLLDLARQTAPLIPGTEVAKLIREMTMDRYDKAKAKRENRPVLTVGWYQTGMTAAVTKWKHNQDRATQATRAG